MPTTTLCPALQEESLYARPQRLLIRPVSDESGQNSLKRRFQRFQKPLNKGSVASALNHVDLCHLKTRRQKMNHESPTGKTPRSKELC